MKVEFKSRLDWFMKSALVLMVIATVVPIYWMKIDNEPFYSLLIYALIMGITLLFMIHLVFTSRYIFEDEKLICKFGFFKKEIEYSQIRKIESGTQIYAGWKMALALKGIIIHYNRFDDLLVSPEEQDRFIEELKKRNPQIELQLKSK